MPTQSPSEEAWSGVESEPAAVNIGCHRRQQGHWDGLEVTVTGHTLGAGKKQAQDLPRPRPVQGTRDLGHAWDLGHVWRCAYGRGGLLTSVMAMW